MKRSILTISGILLFSVLHAQNTSFPTTGTSLDLTNYLGAGYRFYFQFPSHINNNYSRGILAEGIYWDTGTTNWRVNGGSYSDFSMLRLENNGVISLFNRGNTGYSYNLTDTEMETYRRLTILINGNVGIGTKTPTDKLSVNGNIRAREVKVEVANWPDYVFKPDYELISLPEVEAYIQRNGGLLGIPKAEEVEADGVDLGEMNRRLLEKVEEIMLHLIEREKVEKNMKNTIAEMASRLQYLEKQL